MPDDGELVKELLQCIGICEEGTENLLDAVTGLSGSGQNLYSEISGFLKSLKYMYLLIFYRYKIIELVKIKYF
jgi:hypothetical protein